jgi:hypothetical protein
MRKFKLTESQLSKITKKIIREDEEMEADSIIMDIEQYQNLSDDELNQWESNKISWKKAIRECLKELDEKYNTTRYSSLPKKLISILAFAAFLFALGIILKIKELNLMGTGAIMGTAVLSHPEIQEILICARNKRKGVSSTSTDMNNTTNESKMKNTIRLTESELINFIKRVIQEEESTGASFAIKKTVQDIINTKRFNELQEGMMVSIQNNKLTILPGGSESSEEYVIDLSPKTHRNVIEQQTKIIVKGGKLVIKFIDGEILKLEPSMKVIKFVL